MNQDELNAIRERVDAATPGPWHAGGTLTHSWVNGYQHTIWPVESDDVGVACVILPREDDTLNNRRICKNNRDFIAHAREDVPALLAEIDRLRTALLSAYEKMDSENYMKAAYIIATALAEKEGAS